ncbi:MAG: archease [Myxococcales bacterium]|nr:archease [Myxococcales bacterium]MDH5306074.1 archease [Myxococcales bacterium]
MSGSAGYEFVDAVTSDLSFVARGDSLDETFRAAADAVLAATVENPEDVAPRVRRRIALEEPDRELLLLRFLNELVYLRDAEGLLLRAAHVEVEAGPRCVRVSAELVGEPLDAGRHRPASDVKAVTAHGLRVTPAARGWEATVTLDV